MQSLARGKYQNFVQHIWILRAVFTAVSYFLLLPSIIPKPWSENLYTCFVAYHICTFLSVMELIESNRRRIETELKDLLKLCRWDRFESQLSFDHLRKPRQKIQKLIQKYSVSCNSLAVIEDFHSVFLVQGYITIFRDKHFQLLLMCWTGYVAASYYAYS